MKKVLLGVLVVVVVGFIGLFIWARSVLTGDTVRTTLAARLSQTLGQPVQIGDISATVYPRVTVSLKDVTMGPKANIKVGTLDIGTDFRALLSRRIEHGAMRLNGAHIELPLPDFSAVTNAPAAPANATPSAPPVEIVSIDEIVLSGVDVVSGGRTLHGDIEVVPQGKGLLIRRVALTADNAAINITGQISDLTGPVGELTVKAGALNFTDLLAFVGDFSKGAGIAAAPGATTAPAAAPATPSTMNLAIALDADRATMGTLTLDKLSGRAKVTGAGMTIEPISFGVFGGKYDGSLALSLADKPDFRIKANLTSVDVAAATAFAGSPNTVTGRMSGSLDLAGSGMDAPSVEKSAKGTLRADVTNGVVKNLGLIQAVVVATSMRPGAFAQGTGSKDEPFSRLGGTFTIGAGTASTDDLKFESKDLTLGVTGNVRLDGSSIDLKGRAQLSEALSQQGNSEVLRYTQEQGRVTLPATVQGSAEKPQVRIDVADVAKRAVKNRANEEAQKAIGKGLGRLLGGR